MWRIPERFGEEYIIKRYMPQMPWANLQNILWFIIKLPQVCRKVDLQQRLTTTCSYFSSGFRRGLSQFTNNNTQKITVGDRAFLGAVARVWNSLPDFVTASTSLSMFKRHLKTVLFEKSYWTLAVTDDLNTFHRTSFYLRLILFRVLAVVLTLCHLNHICLLTN